MREGSTAQQVYSPATKRLLSVMATCVIGPPLTAAIFICGIGLIDLASMIPEGNFVSKNLLMGIRAGINEGIFPSIVVAIPMLYIFRNWARLPMWTYLLGATLAIGLMPLTIRLKEVIFSGHRTTISNASPELEGLYYFAGLCLIPALLSAMICWRMTRRWHSPEPTP